MPNPMYAPEYQSEQSEIERRRKLAQALMERSMQQPQSRQAGRYVVPPHPMEGLAGLAQMFAGARMQSQAGERESALGKRVSGDREKRLAAALQTAQGGQPMMSQGDMAQNPFPSMNAAQPDPMGAYSQLAASGDPVLMQTGGTMLNQLTQQQNQQENREARLQERLIALQGQMALAQGNNALREQLAAQADQTRRELAQMQDQTRRDLAANRPAPQPMAVIGPDGKPMYVPPDQAIGKQPWSPRHGGGSLPVSAVKLQNEILEDIGIAANTKNDLAALSGKLATGGLNLGLFSNWISRGRNLVGLSSEQSRNFSSFEATLEKLRNDSLRLNKGVQTEGDAVRAWNELLKGINDPGVVQQRLQEIQTINERAVALKQLQIDQLRSNFGMEGLDTRQYQNQPAAVGNNDRRSTQRNGRTVVVDY